MMTTQPSVEAVDLDHDVVAAAPGDEVERTRSAGPGYWSRPRPSSRPRCSPARRPHSWCPGSRRQAGRSARRWRDQSGRSLRTTARHRRLLEVDGGRHDGSCVDGERDADRPLRALHQLQGGRGSTSESGGRQPAGPATTASTSMQGPRFQTRGASRRPHHVISALGASASQQLLGGSVAGYPADLVRVRDHLIPGEAVDLHRRLGREDEDDLSTTGLANDRRHQPWGRAEVDEIGHDRCPLAGEERRGGLWPEGRRRPGAARWEGSQRRWARRWRRVAWFRRSRSDPRGRRLPGIAGVPQHGGADVADQPDDQDAAGRDRDEKPSAGSVGRTR